MTDPLVDLLRRDLRRDEGEGLMRESRYIPYQDSKGIWTIGTGHNLQNGISARVKTIMAGENPNFWHDLTEMGLVPYLTKWGISEATRNIIENEDINAVLIALDRNFPWWRRMQPNRQRAFANMTFNMGVGVKGGSHGLWSFNRFLNYLRGEEYTEAAEEMLRSKWKDDVGHRAYALSDMILNG